MSLNQHQARYLATGMVVAGVAGSVALQFAPSKAAVDARSTKKLPMRVVAQIPCKLNAPCGDMGYADNSIAAQVVLDLGREFGHRIRDLQARVVDKSGRQISCFLAEAPSNYANAFIQRGYGKAVVSPNLEIVQYLFDPRKRGGFSETLIGRFPLRTLPDEKVLLSPPRRQDARLSASIGTNGMWHRNMLALRLADPASSGEITTAEVLASTFVPSPSNHPFLGFGAATPGDSTVFVDLPNLSSVDAAKVRITKSKMVDQVNDVTLSGAELRYSNRAAYFVVSEPVSKMLPNGLKVTLDRRMPRSASAPKREFRSPPLGFSIALPMTKDGHPTWGPASGGTWYELLSPKPQELGLSEIRSGATSIKSPSGNLGAVKTGPITTTIRVHYVKPVVLDTYVTTVRVKPGGQENKELASNPSWPGFHFPGGMGWGGYNPRRTG